MNVSCPQCATVFRVDPAKVPERGVRARCSECGGLIAVRRPQVGTPAVPPVMEAVQPVIAPTPTPAPAPAVSAPPPAPPAPAPEPVAAPVTAAPDPVVETPPVVKPAPEPVPAPRMPVSVPLTAMPVEAPRTAPAPSAAPGRFSNPFLQQDPSVRARRLARALVSDLVVYHPDKRQRGLADGTLKELFAEEIRKSWEEYSEQIGEDVARSTPYFTEALNEILAEGRPLFD